VIKGIDVSHHQAPSAINWSTLAKTHGFVFVRATYGTTRDRACADHVKRARAAGLKVGLYHFYRQTRSVESQLAAFAEVAELVKLGPGDLPPALDLEANTRWDGPPDPVRYGYASNILDAWEDQWGQFIVYTTQAFWHQMGKPARWLDGLLWVAHWGVKEPATPGGEPWDFWQHKVSPLEGVYRHQLDQNVYQGETLPVLDGKAIDPIDARLDALLEEMRPVLRKHLEAR